MKNGSAGRTAPLTGRTILQPKAIRCSWYRVRALVRKCVRRSVCQRAVSARRALTGLSANHVRVKQHHVCPSANFCCVSAGKGSLPWFAFYNASRYIYFTPSQCPLAFKCFCFFPESFPIMFLMVLCMAALIPISPLPLIIPVPWAFYFLPISKILWLSGFFFTPDYPIGFSLLPRIIPLSGPIPFYIVLHIFSHSANWLLHPVITAVLDLFPNVRFFLAQLLLPWFLSLPHVILRYVLVYLFYVLSQRRSVCSCYHSDRELNGNVCHPTNLTQVRWDDSGIVTGIGHLSSHMVQQIQSQFIL